MNAMNRMKRIHLNLFSDSVRPTLRNIIYLLWVGLEVGLATYSLRQSGGSVSMKKVICRLSRQQAKNYRELRVATSGGPSDYFQFNILTILYCTWFSLNCMARHYKKVFALWSAILRSLSSITQGMTTIDLEVRNPPLSFCFIL